MQFGIVGAAVGTAIAAATHNLLAVYFFKKCFGFNTFAVGAKSPRSIFLI